MSRVMPGVTHRLAGRVDTHVNGIRVEDSRPVITRWFYRQRMVADVNRAQRPWILSSIAALTPRIQQLLELQRLKSFRRFSAKMLNARP